MKLVFVEQPAIGFLRSYVIEQCQLKLTTLILSTSSILWCCTSFIPGACSIQYLYTFFLYVK